MIPYRSKSPRRRSPSRSTSTSGKKKTRIPISHSQRVKTAHWLEDLIGKALAAMPRSLIVKTEAPYRVLSRQRGRCEVVLLRKGACDFEGGYKGLFCCFEAKACATDSFDFKSNIKYHQFDRLTKALHSGCLTGIFLYYYKEDPDNIYFISTHDLHMQMVRLQHSLPISVAKQIAYAILEVKQLAIGNIGPLMQMMEGRLLWSTRGGG